MSRALVPVSLSNRPTMNQNKMTGGDFYDNFSTKLEQMTEKIANKKRKGSNDLVLPGNILNQSQHEVMSSMANSTESKQRPGSQRKNNEGQVGLDNTDSRFSVTDNHVNNTNG